MSCWRKLQARSRSFWAGLEPIRMSRGSSATSCSRTTSRVRSVGQTSSKGREAVARSAIAPLHGIGALARASGPLTSKARAAARSTSVPPAPGAASMTATSLVRACRIASQRSASSRSAGFGHCDSIRTASLDGLGNSGIACERSHTSASVELTRCEGGGTEAAVARSDCENGRASGSNRCTNCCSWRVALEKTGHSIIWKFMPRACATRKRWCIISGSVTSMVGPLGSHSIATSRAATTAHVQLENPSADRPRSDPGRRRVERDQSTRSV
mmetsp:Transcript_28444/g.86995  ORF Transcript_28444/g.86995 Transcript_28444/m.86995 type:complete len:271 (-) Transcript_28444:2655-3467(-)